MRPTAMAALALLAILLAACSGGGSVKGGVPVAGVPILTDVVELPAGLSGVGNLPPPASAWPEAGHDARHTSTSSAVGPQQARIRWRAELGGGNATPGPIIATDGSILAATNAGVLFDLDAATGRVRWRFDGHASFGSDLSTSPAVSPTGTVLWPGPNNTLYALDPSGHLIWHQEFDAQVLSPAIAGHGRFYVADLAGNLAAFDVTTSIPRISWRLTVGGPDYASPSVGIDGTIYTAHDHELVAIRDLGDRGAIRWRLRTAQLVEVSNGVAPNGNVVLGTNGDREYGVRPNGTVEWALDIGDYTYSSAIVSPDGLAYFGDNRGQLHVVDSTTGQQRHRLAPPRRGDEQVWTSVALDVRGDFYWGTTRGQLYGYRMPAHELFHMSLDGGIDSYPAIGGDGTLYVATTSGSLYAVG